MGDKYGPAGAAAAAAEESDDDDSDDLFGSDDEEDTAEQERIKAERIAAYNERKAGKKKVAAKSSILLDVKPWDDETNMAEVESNVRTIECDGLLWEHPNSFLLVTESKSSKLAASSKMTRYQPTSSKNQLPHLKTTFNPWTLLHSTKSNLCFFF